VAVDCERCGRSEGLFAACGRRAEDWERTTAGDDGAAADMVVARLVRKEQRETWCKLARCAPRGERRAPRGQQGTRSRDATASVAVVCEVLGLAELLRVRGRRPWHHDCVGGVGEGAGRSDAHDGREPLRQRQQAPGAARGGRAAGLAALGAEREQSGEERPDAPLG
jgi:hypothetical protein